MKSNKESNKIELRVYMKSERSMYNATGVYDGNGIKILKGSVFAPTVTDKRMDAKARARLLNASGTLRADMYFNTPDAAAMYVCGRKANGMDEWKLESGISLTEYLKREERKQKKVETYHSLTAIHISDPPLRGDKHVVRVKRRLRNRITKEFEKKFFVGDIAVNEQEYALLADDAKGIVKKIMTAGYPAADSVLLAVFLVQVGIRKYDGRYYWPYVEEELGIQRNAKNQHLLGDSFVNTLRAHGKHITDATERVQNILFHGFVSDYYSKGLFELLFQYYSKDLERDIYRNTTEQMQALMDTLAKKAAQDEKQSEAFTDQFMAKGSRAYKLKSHTLQAISAHPVHSRTRLRRLIRLIDRAFWKDDVPKNPTSRLTILFKEWINDSPAYKKEYRLYQMGEIRNRGKKHFSTPYIFAHIGRGTFELRLPAQIVAEEFAEDLEWQITTNARTIRLPADTYPVLTGYKTEEGKTAISKGELFGEIQCQLISCGTSIRKFPNLPETSVRFFDMEGDYAPRLFKIPMCAYTAANNMLHSNALLAKVPHGDITRWDFEFQQGDLVVLPDGTGMIVGDHYTNGLIPRGQVKCAEHLTDKGEVLPVYASAPELLLTIPKGKLPGTVLYCNDERYRLTNCQYTEFENKDARGMQAILLPLSQFSFCQSDGVKTVILDVPGAHYDKPYAFALVNGLTVDFPGAPYVFEERGTVVFPEHIQVSSTYEKLPGENGYQFVLDGREENILVSISGDIPLTIKIPMLSWSTDRKNWNVLPAGELWHTEFFEMKKLYIRSPLSKVAILADTDISDDEDEEMHTIFAECGADGIHIVDMTRMRSWLTRAVMKNDIILKLGKMEYTFATVYTKSLVASYNVSADYDEGVLTWVSDIIGKAEYYLDVVHVESGAVLADKKILSEGKLTIVDKLLSGQYRFTLYEAEEDDSGFDDLIYEQLLSTERQLINRNDASGRFLEIRSFKVAHNSNLYTQFKKRYIVTDFKKIAKDIYTGKLLADGEETGLKVTVEFLNPDDMRFFHVTAWHEEEEIDVDLLFDRSLGTLELDQLPGLRYSESYRRYRELTFGEYVYFGILRDNLPDFGVKSTKQNASATYWSNGRYIGRFATSVDAMGFSARTLHVIKSMGIVCAGEIFTARPEQWKNAKNMGRKIMEEIISVMDDHGIEMESPY